jgi:hypothetical protein
LPPTRSSCGGATSLPSRCEHAVAVDGHETARTPSPLKRPRRRRSQSKRADVAPRRRIVRRGIAAIDGSGVGAEEPTEF